VAEAPSPVQVALKRQQNKQLEVAEAERPAASWTLQKKPLKSASIKQLKLPPPTRQQHCRWLKYASMMQLIKQSVGVSKNKVPAA